jgi:diacylglycerol kinase (ATP)
MQVTLIHNEGAGDEGQPGAQELRQLIESAGHDVSYRSAHGEDWISALSAPADIVAVAGGDGTIGRVAKRLAGSAIPLAVLPMGTANNISHTLGIADRPLEDVIAGWDRARTRRLDVGLARGPWGSRRFIEGVGAGVFAWTVPEADASGTLASMQTAESKIAYALQMLKDRLEHCPPIALRATLDAVDLTGEYVLFEAMLMQYIGPNLYLAPHHVPGDGRLDVVMVGDAERDQLFEYLSRWQNDEYEWPALRTSRGRHLTVEWTGFHVHIDDDIWPGDEPGTPGGPARIDITIEAQLSVLVPNGSEE